MFFAHHSIHYVTSRNLRTGIWFADVEETPLSRVCTIQQASLGTRLAPEREHFTKIEPQGPAAYRRRAGRERSARADGRVAPGGGTLWNPVLVSGGLAAPPAI